MRKENEMSYASQLGKKCDQNEYTGDVETHRPNAGRVKNWPFPRLSASAADVSRQQTSFCTESVSIRHDEQFPAQRKR
jgi:hypothetical protein